MSDATRILTYAQLADAFGITGASARNLVRRKLWRRENGNDGQARIYVPIEALPSRTSDGIEGATSGGTGAGTGAPMVNLAPVADLPADAATGGETGADTGTTIERELVAALESRISELKELVDAERARSDRLDGSVATLTTALVAETAARGASETARAVAEARLALIEADLAALKRRGWLRRLIG